MHKTNKLWTVLAFIFLYLSLVIPGPLDYSGNKFITSLCMFCMHTEAYIEFKHINHFIRGFFSLSIALIIYSQWTRKIALMILVAIIYFPLNEVLYILIRSGEYNKVYFIYPLIFDAFSDSSIIWFYYDYELFLMLMGASTALISYVLIRKFSNDTPRIIVPIFALFIIMFTEIFLHIFEQTSQMITISLSSGILFGLAVLFGLRFLLNGRSCNKSLNSTEN